MVDEGIVNIKYTLSKEGSRQGFDPEHVLDPATEEVLKEGKPESKLSSMLNFVDGGEDKFFSLKVKDGEDDVVDLTARMLLVDPTHYYLRNGEIIKTPVNDDQVKIAGLGERVGPYFYNDGIYS